MQYTDIIIAPVLTEKSNEMREQRKYVFKVDPRSTKVQIKEAVRKLFNVKVLNCAVVNVDGKCDVFAIVRERRQAGKRQLLRWQMVNRLKFLKVHKH